MKYIISLHIFTGKKSKSLKIISKKNSNEKNIAFPQYDCRSRRIKVGYDITITMKMNCKDELKKLKNPQTATFNCTTTLMKINLRKHSILA